MDVIDPSTGGTRASSSNPEQQLIIVDLKPYHNRPSPRRARIVKEVMLQQRIQPSGLGRSPRKPIQNVAALQSGNSSRSRTMLQTRSSETSSPRAITAFAAIPSSVPRTT